MTPEPRSVLAGFGAWMFCAGIFGGFWIGYVVGVFL